MLQQSHTPLANGIMSFMVAPEDHELAPIELAPIGIGSMHEQAQKLAEYGRHGDIYFVHAAEGETVVPMEVLNANPKVKNMLFNQMREMGLDPDEFVVGNELNSINPVTGMPEFFFSSLWRKTKKVASKVVNFAKKAAPYVIPLVLSAFGVPFLGAMAPALFGAGTFGAAFMGGGIASLVQGGSLKDALKAGTLAGVINIGTAGLKSAVTGGDFTKGAMKSVYNPGAADFGTQWGRFTAALDPTGPAGSFKREGLAFLGGQAPTSVDYWDALAAPTAPTAPTAPLSVSVAAPAPANLTSTPSSVDYWDALAPFVPKDPAEVSTLENLFGSTGKSIDEGMTTVGNYLFRGGESAEDIAKNVTKAKQAYLTDISKNIAMAKQAGVPFKNIGATTAGLKAAAASAQPGMLAKYGPSLALAGAGYGIYEATQPSAEEEKAEREREAMAKLKKKRAEWYETTGERLFAESRKHPPGHPLHDPDEYWMYVPRPPRRMMATFPSMFGARGGLAEYPPRDLLVEGPGTERSDEIPAMLSDGEFVMNSKSVRGADPSGRGNRYAGANNLYNMMRNFEMRS